MGQNTDARVGALTTNDVKSWKDCSALCQKRTDCKYWTWAHGSSGQWAYQCVTMMDAGGKNYDKNVVSGEKSCIEGGVHFKCPDINQNTDARVGAQTTNDVKSWKDCSALCQKRTDCKYWTWAHGSSGQWAYKCVTMSDAGGKASDTNVVSGEKSCRGGISFECPDLNQNTQALSGFRVGEQWTNDV